VVLGEEQKAAARAFEEALEKTSLPAILEFIPKGFDGVRIKAKIAVPYPVRSHLSHCCSQMGQYHLAFHRNQNTLWMKRITEDVKNSIFGCASTLMSPSIWT